MIKLNIIESNKQNKNKFFSESLIGPQGDIENELSSLLINAIQDELKTIDFYNSLSESARTKGYEDIAKVIDDINTEENIHVGQIQELLKTISPNANAIKDGEEEAINQLNLN